MSMLVAATAKGSLLIALALCVLALAGNRIAPKWRHALLIVALVRLVLPFAPGTPFSVFNLARPKLTAPAPPMLIGNGTGGQFIARRTATPPPVTTIRTDAILLGIWALGALLMLARLAFRVAMLRRRLRVAPPRAIVDANVLAILDACREQLGITRTVALATTSAASTPSLLGGLRPTLLLPPDVADALTTDQLRFIFLHELAHLRRLDVLVNWFVAIVHAFHWFNPLVWIAVSRIAEERELACDAHALEHLGRGERSGYGETVIQLLDQLPMTRTAPGLVGMTTSRRQLKRRILMIASFRSPSRFGAWPAALVAVFALVTLTDARAGERQMMKMRHPMSPAAEATMQRLDQNVFGFELKNATLDELLARVESSTGVTLKVSPIAIDDAKKQARIDISANGVPAHIVLMESLDALDLALDFTDDGAMVIAQPLGDRRLFMKAVPPPEDGNHERTIYIERSEHMAKDGDAVEAMPELRAHDMANIESVNVDKDGVIRRKITFRGKGEEQPQGTLELEVRLR